jgi:hypothetical protein
MLAPALAGSQVILDAIAAPSYVPTQLMLPDDCKPPDKTSV